MALRIFCSVIPLNKATENTPPVSPMAIAKMITRLRVLLRQTFRHDSLSIIILFFYVSFHYEKLGISHFFLNHLGALTPARPVQPSHPTHNPFRSWLCPLSPVRISLPASLQNPIPQTAPMELITIKFGKLQTGHLYEVLFPPKTCLGSTVSASINHFLIIKLPHPLIRRISMLLYIFSNPQYLNPNSYFSRSQSIYDMDFPNG